MNIQEFFKIGMKREIPDLIPNKESGRIFNLGAGNQVIKNAIPLQLPDWDGNLDNIPAEDRSVDQIHAYHFIEHLHDPIRIIVEIDRCLKSDGHANILVPYYKSDLAFCDMDHKRHFSAEYMKTCIDATLYNPVGGISHSFDLEIHANFIMGIVDRNIAIFTQIRRRKL